MSFRFILRLILNSIIYKYMYVTIIFEKPYKSDSYTLNLKDALSLQIKH